MGIDPEIERVAEELRVTPDARERIGRALRNSFDQIYDGQRTGRYNWDQLRKTEKNHFGGMVEINLQREFELLDGERMNLRIRGVEIGCRYSRVDEKWIFPPETVGEACLLVAADDETAEWSIGLIRCRDDNLTEPDRRWNRSLTAEGRQSIRWIWRRERLPANTLATLDKATLRVLFDDLAGPRNGQKRVNELFRRALNRPISREVISTVAQQVDYMRRVRGNGGARTTLKQEGVVIFGDYSSHQALAEALGLAAPAEGEFVGAQLVEESRKGPKRAFIEGRWWRLAAANERPTIPAPDLPSQ